MHPTKTKPSTVTPTPVDETDYVAKCVELDRTIGIRYELLATEYEKPIITSPKDADRVARKISSQFPTLFVSVSYKNGYRMVGAIPPRPSFRDHKDFVRGVKEREEYLKTESNWPEYGLVKAFVDGYDAACEDADTIKMLKEEVAHLKSELMRVYRMGMPPFTRFGM